MIEVEGFGQEVLSVATICAVLTLIAVYYFYRNWPFFSMDFSVLATMNWLVQYVANRQRSSTDADNGQSNGDGASSSRVIVYNQDANCPICLNVYRYATLANCGHVYCCDCIITCWRHGEWLEAVSCPVCRTRVTILIPNFAEVDLNDQSRVAALAEIRTYNRRFSNEPRSIWDHVMDMPVLVPNLFRQLFTLGGLMLMFRLRVILLTLAAAMYILSPLDILPEAILGVFGLLDDLFVGFLLLIYLCTAYRQFLSR